MKHLFVKGLQPPPQGQPPWYPGANGGVSFGTVEPANPIRGHLWWDGTYLWLFDGRNWVTDATTKADIEALMKEIYNDDPEAFRPPVVRDGSLAAPFTVGEVWSATATGTWSGGGSNSVAPLVNMVVAQPALPAGDWDVQWQIILPHMNASNGVSCALVRLPTPLPAGCLNNMENYGVTIPSNTPPAGDPIAPQPFILNGPASCPISIAMQQALIFNLFVWPTGISMATGSYTFNVWGRRVR